MRKKRKDFAVSFKEKCYVINKYEKKQEKRRKCYEKNADFFMAKNNINCEK